MTIVGPGATALAIDGLGARPIFRHNGTGTLSITGLTITHGKYSVSTGVASGGCLLSAGNITLTDSTVSSCIAHATGSASAYGGGIFTGGNLTLNHSRVAYNTAAGPSNPVIAPFVRVGGGGASVAGNLQVSYSTIRNNSADTPDHRAFGGGLFTYGNANVEQSTIAGNRADRDAGWLATSSHVATISISNSTISGNSAFTSGGALFTTLPLTLSNSTIAFNRAAYYSGCTPTR